MLTLEEAIEYLKSYDNAYDNRRKLMNEDSCECDSCGEIETCQKILTYSYCFESCIRKELRMICEKCRCLNAI